MSTNQINFNQFNHCPFLVFSKDQDMNYTYYNDAFQLTKNSSLGRSDKQLPWYSVAEVYQRNDRLALENGFYQGIEPMPVGGEIKFCMVQKSILRNQHNEVIGLMGFAHLANNKPLSGYINSNVEFPLETNTAKDWFNGISMREFDILYYIVRGHTASDIAKQLNISKRTVESYISSAKARFRVRNKPELIQSLIQKGFALFVPNSRIN